MAKLKTDDILESDLNEYLNSSSDFGFEQEVFKSLLELDFDAQHGGTYTDPATGTPREFDIRGRKSVTYRFQSNIKMILRVAVECKNIPASFPLLVECVPRSRDERFHEIVQAPQEILGAGSFQRIRITLESMYREGQPVGKSCCQVGRATGGEISSTDSGVYSKWSQAIASLAELCEDSKVNQNRDRKIAQWTALIPFVVVPDDRLWIVEYDGQGNRCSDPKKVNHISYWVNKPIADKGRSELSMHWFSISHIEFCTKTGLKGCISKWTGADAELLFSTP